MPIYRIRRYSGYRNGSNYYHHADVIARSPASAMKAAREKRMTNWRWIDRYDTSDKDYCYYDVLYRVDPSEARDEQEPLAVERKKNTNVDKRRV